MAQKLKSREDWDQLLSSVDTILFDCDGVLWSGDGEPVDGAKDALQFLRSEGKKLCFVTNNSSKSRAEYLKRFKLLEMEAHQEEVYCTAYIVAHYLKHILRLKSKVYLLGMPGFAEELDRVGIKSIGCGEDPMEGGISDWMAQTLDPEVGAVVVGFDCFFNYMKLIKACSYLRNPACHFIATNEDTALPSKSQILIPGTGCFVRAVACGSEREPTVVGKPHKPMFDVLQDSTKLDPSRTLIVGDRLNTDIWFGRVHGMKTLLVFSGFTSPSRLAAASIEQSPDYYCQSIAEFLQCKAQPAKQLFH